MKNKKIALAVIVSVLTLFILTGCGNKKAISTETFESVSKKHGNEITDLTEQYKDYGNFKNVMISKHGDDWKIEFYVLDSEESASNMFSVNKESFLKEKGNTNTESSIKSGNHESYTLTSNGYYMHLYRIDNTLLYVKVRKENKAAAQKLIKDLGY